MPQSPGSRAVCLLAALLLLFGLSPPGNAQQITYQYDALGRLILVSTPEGIAEYEYDAVGNLLRIVTHKYADLSGPVAILGMSPSQGAPGTNVQLYGRGFGATPAENQVAFNGATAAVAAATATALTVTVPVGATTGPVSVTAPQGSATSADPFTVLQALVIQPDHTEVVLRGVVGFQATLAGVPITAVTWRVNGVDGGNATVGTISATGLYTAPSVTPPVQPVPVEAVLTADPSQIARANVQVVGQAAGLVSAAAVSLAPPGTSIGVAAAPVTFTGGPTITGVTPATGAPGVTNLSVTVTGTGLTPLSGSPPVQLLWNGAPDGTVTITAPTASPDGTQVSFVLTIGSGAAHGSRIVYVGTSHGGTSPFAVSGNTFTVGP